MLDDCVFCRIIRGEIPSAKVYEDGENLVFRDIKPAAPVHFLAVPKRHVARLADCGEADAGLLSSLLLAAGRAARRENVGDFRLLVNDGAGAGQTVFHLHAHILSVPGLTEKLL
jgi:histidine triad (HIT) family protein